MKLKVLFLLLPIALFCVNVNAQKRGARIGYIDTEYILENVSEYQQANAQLDKKAQKWKADIEKLLSEINLQKEELDKERVLLTNELYEERLEDIKFEESKILDYQRKRFGVNGDLITQKAQLMKPVQDQIFAAVQEIAELKKLDFVFDKSNDVVMLYSSKRYDISDQIIKMIKRSEKRKQGLTNKERREIAEEEEQDKDTSDSYNDREENLQAKREAAEKAKQERIEARERQKEEKAKEREALREAKRRELEERRAAAKARREKQNAPKNEDNNTDSNSVEGESKTNENADGGDKQKTKTTAQLLEERRQKKETDRKARQKALDERKKQLQEKKRKAREERVAKAKKRDSIAKANKNN